MDKRKLLRNTRLHTGTRQVENTMKDAETDTSGFIPPDHYPIIAKAKVKFKAAISRKTKPRKKYEKTIKN